MLKSFYRSFKHGSVLILLILLAHTTGASDKESSPTDSLDRTAWFREAKFGIFVHWGLYSLIGYTEWCQHSFEIKPDVYARLQDRFNPVKFDPNAWADLFAEAGARYVVMTAKHHDGFSMYDTRSSDYSIMQTAYGQDVLGMLNQACRKRNLRFGIYYSIMDWHHPDYLPRRYFDDRPTQDADLGRYKTFMTHQVSELVYKYQPALLWFDGEWENTLDSLETVGLVHLMLAKKPDLIFNNRLSRFGFGDFKTPENTIPPTGLKNADGSPAVWESCSTMGDSWGYNPFADSFYSERELIRMLVEVCSKGGNLLLNVGPTPEGTIQPEFQIRLLGMGKWLKTNGEAIYGTTASIFDKLPFYGKSTTKGNSVYLHVFMFPRDHLLRVPRLVNPISRITLLTDGRELKYSNANNQIQIQLPPEAPDINATVLKLEVEGPPQVASNTPEYSPADTLLLDIPSAVILPTDNALESVQSYDRILIKNWTTDNRDCALHWEFRLQQPQRYKLYVKCASSLEKQGDITAALQADDKIFEVKIEERPQWTYMRKYLYTPVFAGEVNLPAGNHTINFRVLTLQGKQALTFEQVIMMPQN
jgi:alpha-L-fucosidase